MYESMAHAGQVQPEKSRKTAQADERPEVLSRQARVQELRRLVLCGEYEIDSRRLALKIMAKALRASKTPVVSVAAIKAQGKARTSVARLPEP
jgi:hypothetical protein